MALKPVNQYIANTAVTSFHSGADLESVVKHFRGCVPGSCPPDVLSHPDGTDVVGSVGIIDQHPLPFGEDCRVGGLPLDAQVSGNAGDAQEIHHDRSECGRSALWESVDIAAAACSRSPRQLCGPLPQRF